MTFQGELYAKELGQARVERTNEEWVVMARRQAARISAQKGSVSVVDLHTWAEASGIHPESELAYSGVFKGKEWVATGAWVQCRHEGGHARRVCVWRYVSTKGRTE
jgi:hypothetical protein